MMIDRYGADTMRLFSMSDTPPHQSLEWKEGGVEGMHRFIKRVWRELGSLDSSCRNAVLGVEKLDAAQKALRRKTHETIAKVTDDIDRRMTFNTAIASMMELFNDIAKFDDRSDSGKAVMFEACSALVRLLSPFVPHVTHELWQQLGHQSALIDESWPEVDQKALVRDELELVVQVNGKRRASIMVAANASKDECEAAAKEDESIKRHLDGLNVIKVIVVPGRLINIVAKQSA